MKILVEIDHIIYEKDSNELDTENFNYAMVLRRSDNAPIFVQREPIEPLNITPDIFTAYPFLKNLYPMEAHHHGLGL